MGMLPKDEIIEELEREPTRRAKRKKARKAIARKKRVEMALVKTAVKAGKILDNQPVPRTGRRYYDPETGRILPVEG